MTFADLFKEMMDTSKERLKTPLTGAFIWAFMCYNWKPLTYLIFSEMNIEEKIYIISKDYSSFERIWHPILFAFLIILFVPVVTVVIEMLMRIVSNQKVSNQFAAKKHKIGQMKLIAKDEIELKNVQTENKTSQDYINEIQELNSTNENLIQEQKIKLETERSLYDELQNQIKQLEVRNIELVKSHTNTVEANNNTIKQLNSQVEKAISNYADLLKKYKQEFDPNPTNEKDRLELYKVNIIRPRAENLSKKEKELLLKLKYKSLNYSMLSPDIMTKFIKNDLIDSETYEMTVIAKLVTEYIEENEHNIRKVDNSKK